MCGFVGIFSSAIASPVSQTLLNAMCNRLIHRGPDGNGTWVNTNRTIGLGHRRLAIQDLSPAGQQPMESHSGRFVIAFNGEIYNHLALRETIHDTNWRGHSDTETLLECIEKQGLERTLQVAAGMFAFALWDKARDTLTLARDRIGEKPLYYKYITDDGESQLIFASEIKAFKAFPGAHLEINPSAVRQFLAFGYIPAPNSIYKNISKIHPGELLEISLSTPQIKTKRYWHADSVYRKYYTTRDSGRTFSGIVDELGRLLSTVISEQMLADVPVGAFLSGGIDSSLVVAMMREQTSQKVRTYTVGYGEPGYSESDHAEKIAKHLDTDHTSIQIDGDMARAFIEKLPLVFDEPFADPSMLPTLLISGLASKSVKVVLTGDGGDEIFCGYNRYVFANQYWPPIRLVPKPIRTAAGKAILAIPEGALDRLAKFLPVTSVGYKLHKAASILACNSAEELYERLVRSQEPSNRAENAASIDYSRLVDPGQEKLHLIDRMALSDTLSYLPDDILVKVDRSTMSFSMESRAPLLDYRVIEFAWKLPMHAKLQGTHTKRVLRALLSRSVPTELFDRPKMGFGFPIDIWLRTCLRDWASELIFNESACLDGIVDPHTAQVLWDNHLKKRANNAYKLWPILMYQAWHRAERTSS